MELSVRDAVVVVDVLCVDLVQESDLRSFRRMIRSCSGESLFLRTMSEDCWEERDRRASGYFCSSGVKENSVLARIYKAPSVPHEQMVQCCLVWKLLWSSADNVHFLTSLESVMSSHSSECISSQASVIRTWCRRDDHSHSPSRTTSQAARRLSRSTTKQDD